MSRKVIMKFNGHDIEGDAATLADINNKLTQHAALLAALRDMMKVYDRDPYDAAGWIVRARAAVAAAGGAVMTRKERRDFVVAYLECALWAETASGAPEDTSDGTFDTSFDHYGLGIDDIAPRDKRTAMRDCLEFIRENDSLLECAGLPEQNGHDYWLTRQRHGAGFWDRGYHDRVSKDLTVGQALTDAAHAAGSRDLYLGEDGLVYGF